MYDIDLPDQTSRQSLSQYDKVRERNYALLNSTHHLTPNHYHRSYADEPNTKPPKYTISSQISKICNPIIQLHPTATILLPFPKKTSMDGTHSNY